MKCALAAILALCALGCGGEDGPGSNAEADPATGVFVEQRVVGGGIYIEGAFSYLEVKDESGATVAEGKESLRGEVSFRFPLPPGDYVLVSYQRPCSGNCGSLDPPRERCEAEITISDRFERVRVNVTPGSGCEIDLDPSA